MAGIFISYRRDETAAAARAICERLRRELGCEHVFMDVDRIPPGGNFKKHIDAQLAGCRLMLVVIGRQWATLSDKSGRPRLHARNDFVRYEVAAGLSGVDSGRLKLVPVLVDDASMPLEDDLPDDLKDLVCVSALQLGFKRNEEYVLRELVDLAKSCLQRPGATSPGQTTPMAVLEAEPSMAIASLALVRNSWAEPWMSQEGEDHYGRWADLIANGETQRFRWIEPGEFWMGSTEAELNHIGLSVNAGLGRSFRNELPCHKVRLTHGFWLADTACTQALWQAVMKDNPSTFTGDLQLPVERVSWNDVSQKFLPELNRHLCGAKAFLPTEAQWEYSCRAGTRTVYHFGDSIDATQVNCCGNIESRNKTVAVKELPANAWGLYQMHGNVWELCSDYKRIYDNRLVINPSGWQGDINCTIRGGAWSHSGLYARSACRAAIHRGWPDQFIGFRFALRSIEPGAGGR